MYFLTYPCFVLKFHNSTLLRKARKRELYSSCLYFSFLFFQRSHFTHKEIVNPIVPMIVLGELCHFDIFLKENGNPIY